MVDSSPGSVDVGGDTSSLTSSIISNVLNKALTDKNPPIATGETWLGNMALVAVGVILGLGALLIGSRDTVVKVSSTVAKTAAAVGV